MLLKSNGTKYAIVPEIMIPFAIPTKWWIVIVMQLIPRNWKVACNDFCHDRILGYNQATI
eukprot:949645-Amphidinium_carterae.1